MIEAGTSVVFPGLVDTHVHVNEPGRTGWEGFASATRAAAAGGVTCLLDMPLNSLPPTLNPAALALKRRAAEGQCAIDVGFLGGVVPGNTADLPALQAEGVFGFKCFLCPSGVDEFPPVGINELEEALPVLAVSDALLMAHAELPEELLPPSGDPRDYGTWLGSRPVRAEVEAVQQLIFLARRTGARIHVVHVSAPESARLIREARESGVRISGETCPHYLRFTAEGIPAGATELKCAPPIRDRAAREGLWRALQDGSLGMVVSDHSPAPPDLKRREEGNFLLAWGGIASLQLRLPIMWTLARNRGIELDALVPWLCAAPAALAGLSHRKGELVPGRDADLVVWNPEEAFTVTEELLRHRWTLTPWLGHRLAGVVEATYLRGVPIYRQGAPDPPASGMLLSRRDS